MFGQELWLGIAVPDEDYNCGLSIVLNQRLIIKVISSDDVERVHSVQ